MKEFQWYGIINIALVITGVLLFKENDNALNRLDQMKMRIGKAAIPLEQRYTTKLVGRKIEAFQLSSVKSGSFSCEALNSKLIVFIFFSPRDCSPCLSEASLWSEIDTTYNKNDVTVIGIVTGVFDKEEVNRFIEERQLKFPILLDEKEKVKKSIGVTITPMRILVDGSDRRIIDASISSPRFEKHSRFMKLLDNLISN